MNLSLVARLLSRITFLIAATMLFSLPWAHPAFSDTPDFEYRGFFALIGSMIVSLVVGGLLWHVGRKTDGRLYRREAMATVGLSWVLATFLGALPFALSGTARGIISQTVPVPVDPGREKATGGTGQRQPGRAILVTRQVLMNPADCLFEAQSGFSTTGATVLTELENPELVPRCILFWRSSTHFLGGLGIIVLFGTMLSSGLIR